MSEISKGMVVQLVSGGPRMAVVEVEDYSDTGGPEHGALCSWFDDKKNPQEKIFDVAVLKECATAVGSLSIGRG